ncbi:hypothetical protein B0H10DRAFT_1856188, partial [Mycena sp. CBHHK59/15]
KSQHIALLGSLLVFEISKQRMVPRQYQLEGADAVSCGVDSLVDSGTGSGKTICLFWSFMS